MKYILLLSLLLFTQHANATDSHFEVSLKLKRLIKEVENQTVTISEALLRIEEKDIDLLLKPSIKTPVVEQVAFHGHCACRGAVSGAVCFHAEKLAEYKATFGSVIWMIDTLSNDDLCYLKNVDGICAFKEDPSSHSIIVVRVHDIPCITLLEHATAQDNGITTKTGLLQEGDIITLDAFNGVVYPGEQEIFHPSEYQLLDCVMNWTDQYARLSVHGNADTAEESAQALKYGAKGVDPRSEHMFFQPDSLNILRKIILQPSQASAELEQLKEIQRKELFRLFRTMKTYPVKIRLLDPPLHEFLPNDRTTCEALAKTWEMSFADLQAQLSSLSEENPMMGHRGVRLLLTFPELLIMQARAIFEAASDCAAEGIDVEPVIILPMVVSESEVLHIKNTLEGVHKEACQITGRHIRYQLGAMIETPRACLLASGIAEHVTYFSFGTNDLTALTFGFSRGDVFGKFLNTYLDSQILPKDPFSYLDPAVILLMDTAVKQARNASHPLSIGICGEQASERSGIFACHQLGLDSVSCSATRIPAARLFAAQAAVLYRN